MTIEELWQRKLAILEEILQFLKNQESGGTCPTRSVQEAELRLVEAQIEYLTRERK